jgi:acetolactate synthase I/II/III large subunit
MASKPKVSGTINALLARTAVSVVGTFQAAGAISRHDFPYYGGRVGQLANQPADALLHSGDVVITIGYDAIEYWPSLWNKSNERPFVHIDVVPAKVENDYSPAVELIGESKRRSTRSRLSFIVRGWIRVLLNCFNASLRIDSI